MVVHVFCVCGGKVRGIWTRICEADEIVQAGKGGSGVAWLSLVKLTYDELPEHFRDLSWKALDLSLDRLEGLWETSGSLFRATTEDGELMLLCWQSQASFFDKCSLFFVIYFWLNPPLEEVVSCGSEFGLFVGDVNEFCAFC